MARDVGMKGGDGGEQGEIRPGIASIVDEDGGIDGIIPSRCLASPCTALQYPLPCLSTIEIVTAAAVSLGRGGETTQERGGSGKVVLVLPCARLQPGLPDLIRIQPHGSTRHGTGRQIRRELGQIIAWPRKGNAGNELGLPLTREALTNSRAEKPSTS